MQKVEICVGMHTTDSVNCQMKSELITNYIEIHIKVLHSQE